MLYARLTGRIEPAVRCRMQARTGGVQAAVLSAILNNACAPYTGPTLIVPAAHTQVLPTAGKRMKEDVVVEPIPANWGLITYDGTTAPYLTIT